MASIHLFPQAFNEQETAALFQKYLPVRALPEDMENRLLTLVSRSVRKEFTTVSQPFIAWLRSYFFIRSQQLTFSTSLVVLASIIIFVIVSSTLRPDTLLAETALLQPTSNGVTVHRKDQPKAIAIAAGEPFEMHVGDQLRTVGDGVIIDFFPGQRAHVAANTSVELRRLDESDEKTVVELFVAQGLVHSEVESKSQKQTEYRVLSHAVFVNVNGTIFDLDVESPTKATVVAFVGEVAVESYGQSIILTAGQKVQAIVGQPLTIEPQQQQIPVVNATALLTPTLTQTSNVSNVCSQLIQDGGFERHTTWVLPSSGSASYVSDIVYQGATSVRMGIPDSSANVVSYSSVYQDVQLPVSVNQITLRVMAWQAADSSTLDRDLQYIWLILEDGTVVRLWQGAVNLSSWQPISIDLSGYAGKRVQLLLGVFNDGHYGKTVMYVDSVGVDVC